MIKVLNLYAGIGGNRRLWRNVRVTAVESNALIAEIYQRHFPRDRVITGDAHQYLTDHFREFDFIWTSPPCQSHSSFRQNICVRFRNTPAVYPDMRLYQEILFLRYNARCRWVVENVKPYYQPLIEGRQIGRHLLWSNFEIPDTFFGGPKIREAQIPQLQQQTGFDLSKDKLSNKRQILRNCVDPKLGLHVLKAALKSPRG
ncbi:DNA (cytosine-5)-methyltransferase 1 [Chryseobacterium sp. 52]|uniref:DNA cytosine methyltransferase n=1 Tax=Chryseobacterium sp. 52 TaxID=2035213 RepID=UPI000C42652C|nr:DNA cytosine methyltransferase [Chryseobacterium sp. 52]PIF45294.1 DNA (cytosine-5)-methyltransferase 1 [Chryseobacterium sp. 52]